jgi:hypothetical protein
MRYAALALFLMACSPTGGATRTPVDTTKGHGFKLECLDDKRFCENEAKSACAGKTAVVIGNEEEKPETGPNAQHWIYRITVVCR